MMAERGLAMAHTTITATSGRSRPSCCAYSLERGARGLKPAQLSSERFARDGYLHQSRFGDPVSTGGSEPEQGELAAAWRRAILRAGGQQPSLGAVSI